MQTEEKINICPDPHILYVLTYAVMRPIDSLCELIDNSIDSFSGRSVPDSGRLIAVDLPTRREVDEGIASIRVRDNGPGMTLEGVQNSLRAGYSSKRRHGQLGLFGVGFNIASGKLGRTTRLITAQAGTDFAIEVVVDLVALRRSGQFDLMAKRIDKPANLEHGTIVEVSSPWAEDNQNYGFMQKLVGIGRPRILGSLGRIYATLLRDKKMRLMIGEDTVEPYYHCIWGDERFVEHQKHGRIPAVFRFSNQAIHVSQRCAECDAVVENGEGRCPDPSCGSTSTTTLEERISGWLGIQRYMDASHYGIDLIRNGRAIRTLEKEAFFEFQNPDTGEPIVDYPIDDRQGRIVGEIHMNHVPVDPSKQNFERSSPEWKRAIEFLRGTSSLQPTQPGAESNQSPIFKLYQGYRKIREPGKRSMYMGKWTPGARAATLLPRSEIDRLKERFAKYEPGYFDDTEWWKLVEMADSRPVPGLKKCPASGCGVDNLEDAETCSSCGHVFEGKQCINKDCGATIPKSALSCPQCGFNQIPEVLHPWECAVCGATNSEECATCTECNNQRGALSPVSLDRLNANSESAEQLTINALTLVLPTGEITSPLRVVTRLTRDHITAYDAARKMVRLPLVRIVAEEITLFIDPAHPLFTVANVSHEECVANEVASYIVALYQSRATKYPAQLSVTKIACDIVEKYWPDKFMPQHIAVQEEISDFLTLLRERLAASVGPDALECYESLPTDEKTSLAHNITRSGRDLSELRDLVSSGDYFLFASPRAIMHLFKYNPALFFDGKVFDVTYSSIPSTHPEAFDAIQTELKARCENALAAIVLFSESTTHEQSEVEMARAALQRLKLRITH